MSQVRKGIENMLTKNFVMNCAEGFHLRPAQVLMEKATPFQSRIMLGKPGQEEADAKSILGLMSLGIEQGEIVEVVVEGRDETEAMAVVEKLFETNFGE